MNVQQCWVIREEIGNNKFIVIDSVSGGYPYTTDFWQAEKVTSFEKANNYVPMGWGTSQKAKKQSGLFTRLVKLI